MSTKKQKGQLYRSMQAMSVIPLLVVGLVTTVFSYHTVASTIHEEIHTELKNVAESVVLTYDLLYPGDYALVGDVALDLVKGGRVLTSDYSIIDQIKANTDMEITLFYQDTRILTTLYDANGSRLIGTGATARICEDVLETGEAHFYTNSVINGEPYFSYYMPLKNADGSVAGMVYAGKPCSQVNASLLRAVLPIILIALFSTVIVSYLSSAYTKKLSISLQKIRTFLAKVSTGNLSEEMDAEVLKRRDDLSEMARSALDMQRSLRILVEQDALTGLNNRRFADKRLRQTRQLCNNTGTPFVVAISDIDLFKKINDTYGHECGDVALKEVASILKNHMVGKGFVARWGGEEFLFIFDHCTLAEAKASAVELLNKIRNLTFTYEDQVISVTMTFGLAQADIGCSIKTLLQEADARLYEGKSNGRNQVVAEAMTD